MLGTDWQDFLVETWYQFLRKQALVVFLITDELIIWWEMEHIYKKKAYRKKLQHLGAY